MEEEGAKKVVDQVACWLRLYDDGSVDRTFTGPPGFAHLAAPHHPSPDEAAKDGVSLQDISLPQPFNVSLRIYSPILSSKDTREDSNTDEYGDDRCPPLVPVLLHYPGGGFCISSPTWLMYYKFYSRLSSSLPAVIVSVSPRLAPEHRLPASIDDCYNALLWLRSLSQQQQQRRHNPLVTPTVQPDLSRVFLIGDSSGANLVHLVAARAGADGEGFWSPLRVAGGVPINPGFVRAERSRSELEGEEDPFLTLEMVDKFLAMALPVGATKDHPYTCPMGTNMEELRLPPMMVVIAEKDLIRDTAMEYCEALREAGKEVEVFWSTGVGHSFYLNGVAVEADPVVGRAAAELVDAIKAFVKRHEFGWS